MASEISDKLSVGYLDENPVTNVPRRFGVRSAETRIPSSSPKCPRKNFLALVVLASLVSRYCSSKDE